MPRFTLLALVLALGLAACVPQPAVQPEPPPEPPPSRPEAPTYPAYETFDPSAYDAPPAPPEPDRAGGVEHDVPEMLMAGTITERAPATEPVQTVQGFRIQVFSSESKPAADRVRDELGSWWRSLQGEGVARAFPYGLEPRVEFVRPYYRVRAGAFETREEAQDALEFIRDRFPEAFLVPDTVTLSRTD